MISKQFRYKNWRAFFREGVPVFINLSKEKSEPHLHAHNFIEISYVMEGRGVHVLGENEYPVAPGDLFIINFDTPHEFRSSNNSSDQPLKVYNCLFRPEFIASDLADAKDFIEITYHLLFRGFFYQEDEARRREIRIVGKNYLEIREIYMKMHKEFNLQDQGFLEMLHSKVVELLITIFRIYRNNNEHYTTDNSNYSRNVVGKLTEYIQKNLSSSLNLEELSLLTFLSRTYLCRIFKEETGMTLTEFQQKVRIEEACRLLTKTNLKVYEIMLQVGYSDPKHFNMIFKKVNSVTPFKHRKNAK